MTENEPESGMAGTTPAEDVTTSEDVGVAPVQRLEPPKGMARQPSPTPPRQRLPFPPEPCYVHPYNLAVGTRIVCRDSELISLFRWIADSYSGVSHDRVYCIEALGGMGKSALAWTWIKELSTSDKNPFDAIAWYSFYAVEPQASYLPAALLPYLRGLSGIDDILSADITDEEKLRRILGRKKVLLVLDGFERTLRFYTEFGARSVEGGQLEEMLDLRARDWGRSTEPNLAESVQVTNGRRFLTSPDANHAALLEMLLGCANSRVLITSRFTPSTLLDPLRRPVAGVRNVRLNEFDEAKTRILADSMSVEYDEVFDEVRRRLGGYPLYLSIAMDHVRNGSGSPDAREECIRRLRATVSGADIEVARRQLVSLGLQGLGENDEALLAEIECYPTGCGFADLAKTIVGPEREFARPSDLIDRLEYLHERKLIGWDPGHQEIDMHPVIREAVRGHVPNRPDKVIARMDGNVHSIPPESLGRAELGPALRMPFQILNALLRKRLFDKAAVFYETYLDSILRFHSAEIASREAQLLNLLGHEAEYSASVRARLANKMADTLRLQLKLAEARRFAEDGLNRAAEAGDANEEAQAHQLLAGIAVMQGEFREADRCNRDGIARLQAAGELDPNYSRWLWCQRLHLEAALGLREADPQLGTKLVNTFGQDADTIAACFDRALADGNLDEAQRLLEVHGESSRRNALFYSSLMHTVMAAELANAKGDLAAQSAQLEQLVQDFHSQYFLDARTEAEIWLSRALSRRGEVGKARDHAETASRVARARGARLLESLAQLALVEAAIAANETATARTHLGQLANTLSRPGLPYVHAIHWRAVRALAERLGMTVATPSGTRDPLSREHYPYPALPEPAAPTVSPDGITDTRGMTPSQVHGLLEQTKLQLDWANTTGSARRWWEAFEQENYDRMPLVLRLADELKVRRATITEFFLSYVYSNTDNIQANLHYLDYRTLKAAEDKERRDAARSGKPRADALLTLDRLPAGEGPSAAAEPPSDSSERLRTSVRWDQARDQAKRWWRSLELEFPRVPGPLARFAELLAGRDAGIDEAFDAYVYSNSNDPMAVLSYLDYSRLKREEEQRKRAHSAAIPEEPGRRGTPSVGSTQ